MRHRATMGCVNLQLKRLFTTTLPQQLNRRLRRQARLVMPSKMLELSSVGGPKTMSGSSAPLSKPARSSNTPRPCLLSISARTCKASLIKATISGLRRAPCTPCSVRVSMEGPAERGVAPRGFGCGCGGAPPPLRFPQHKIKILVSFAHVADS